MKTVYLAIGGVFIAGGIGLAVYANHHKPTPEPVVECYAVFKEGMGGWPSDQANVIAAAYDGVPATDIQLSLARERGAEWCSPAWTATAIFGTPSFLAQWPLQDKIPEGCTIPEGNGEVNTVNTVEPVDNLAGVTVYGVKPREALPGYVILPFNKTKDIWSYANLL